MIFRLKIIFMKRTFLRALDRLGYVLIKKKSGMRPTKASMQLALKRLAEKSRFDVIVDIGAAGGTWTEMAMKYWPDAYFELVEPLLEQKRKMSQKLINHQSLRFNLAVAGSQSGKVQFNVSDDLDGSGIYGASQNAREVQVLTLNEILTKNKGRALVKLDTHGYEIPILKGASEVIDQIDAFIIEVYGFKVSKDSLLFHELSTYLWGLGFRLIDLVDITHRPIDEAFWQADAVYVREDHPAFSYTSYR